MSSWRLMIVSKIWGRGWSADKVGLGVGSGSWVVLVAIVVDSPWVAIAFSHLCYFSTM
jgi:hypothetical protein